MVKLSTSAKFIFYGLLIGAFIFLVVAWAYYWLVQLGLLAVIRAVAGGLR